MEGGLQAVKGEAAASKENSRRSESVLSSKDPKGEALGRGGTAIISLHQHQIRGGKYMYSAGN